MLSNIAPFQPLSWYLSRADQHAAQCDGDDILFYPNGSLPPVQIRVPSGGTVSSLVLFKEDNSSPIGQVINFTDESCEIDGATVDFKSFSGVATATEGSTNY